MSSEFSQISTFAQLVLSSSVEKFRIDPTEPLQSGWLHDFESIQAVKKYSAEHMILDQKDILSEVVSFLEIDFVSDFLEWGVVNGNQDLVKVCSAVMFRSKQAREVKLAKLVLPRAIVGKSFPLFTELSETILRKDPVRQNTIIELVCEKKRCQWVLERMKSSSSTVQIQSAAQIMLRTCIRQGNRDSANWLLDSFPLLNIDFEVDGASAIGHLMNLHCFDLAFRLLRQTKRNVVNPGFNRISALHYAVKFGAVAQEIFDFLLKNDEANLDSETVMGETALHWAIQFGNIPMMCQLLDSDSVSTRPNKSGNSLLHLAIENQQLEVIKCLLFGKYSKIGKSMIESKNLLGQTVLYCAVSSGNVEIVDTLLQVPLNVFQWSRATSTYSSERTLTRSEVQESAIHLACGLGDTAMVSVFLKHKIDKYTLMTHKTSSKYNVIDIALLCYKIHIAEMLMSRFKSYVQFNSSFLYLLVSRNNVAFVKFVIDNFGDKINFNAPLPSKSPSASVTALELAVSRDFFDIAKLLLPLTTNHNDLLGPVLERHNLIQLNWLLDNIKVDLDAPIVISGPRHHATSDMKTTPLMFLAKFDIKLLERLILQNRAKFNANVVDFEGNSVLFYATTSRALYLLFEFTDVDANITNNRGQSPLQLHSTDQDLEIFEYILHKTTREDILTRVWKWALQKNEVTIIRMFLTNKLPFLLLKHQEDFEAVFQQKDAKKDQIRLFLKYNKRAFDTAKCSATALQIYQKEFSK